MGLRGRDAHATTGAAATTLAVWALLRARELRNAQVLERDRQLRRVRSGWLGFDLSSPSSTHADARVEPRRHARASISVGAGGLANTSKAPTRSTSLGDKFSEVTFPKRKCLRFSEVPARLSPHCCSASTALHRYMQNAQRLQPRTDLLGSVWAPLGPLVQSGLVSYLVQQRVQNVSVRLDGTYRASQAAVYTGTYDIPFP